MQAVGVSAVDGPPVPPRAERSARHAHGRRRRKAPKPIELDDLASTHLSNKIRRVVCSDPWHWHCKGLILAGEVALKDDQAKELRRLGVYPPGGVFTGMEKCSACGHWCPPDRYSRQRHVKKLDNGQVEVTLTDWVAVCGDCYYADMPLAHVVHVPSSAGFSRRIPDEEAAAHVGRADGTRIHAKRRRVLADDGLVYELVHETELGDDGRPVERVYQTAVFEVVPAAVVAAAEAAAQSAGREA